MERKKEITPASSVLRWRKIGGGSFRLASGKIVKPNESFLAEEKDIPLAFRDCVKCLSTEAELAKAAEAKAAVAKELETPEGIFIVKGSKAKGFNVFKEGDDKPLNETPFETKEEAYELKETLEA